MGSAILIITGCLGGLGLFLFGVTGWALVYHDPSDPNVAKYGVLGFIFMLAGLAAIGQTLKAAGL